MKNLLFTALFASVALCASAQKTVFVSPAGNDAWTGEQHRPFKTLNRAFVESETTTINKLATINAGNNS